MSLQCGRARGSGDRQAAKWTHRRGPRTICLHFGPCSDIVLFGCCSGTTAPGSTSESFMPLTKRQREILNYLSTYGEEHGYAPSFEEIASHFNYNSLATVHEHLSNLERKGYIKR